MDSLKACGHCGSVDARRGGVSAEACCADGLDLYGAQVGGEIEILCPFCAFNLPFSFSEDSSTLFRLAGRDRVGIHWQQSMKI
jgi:hypothetical protein